MDVGLCLDFHHESLAGKPRNLEHRRARSSGVQNLFVGAADLTEVFLSRGKNLRLNKMFLAESHLP